MQIIREVCAEYFDKRNYDRSDGSDSDLEEGGVGV